MKKNLSATEQDTKVIPSKTKSMMGNTNKIAGYKFPVIDKSWMQRLWSWADENNISNDDLPRDENKLLALKFLNLEKEEADGYYLNEIPKEIGMLSNLFSLSFTLYGDSFKEIPEEIGMLTNLGELLIDVHSFNGKELQLPKSIVNLTDLWVIGLTGPITTASIELLIQNCEFLGRLYIDNNPILKTLPTNICHCSSMKELVLINNRNLLLTPNQFKWAINLRDNEKGYDKTYCTLRVDGTLLSYTTDYGQKFQYYSITPFGRSVKIPKPNFPSEEELFDVECN